MTQSSTGHQHRPVLKIFLSKKNQIASPVPHPFSLLFFFFPPSCSIFLLCFSRTDFCSSQTEKKRWEEKKSAREEKNKQKGRSEEPEKLHLSYNIQVKITKTKNYKKNYTTQEIQHSADT